MVVREWRRKIKTNMMMKELITITNRDRISGRGSYDSEGWQDGLGETLAFARRI